MKRIEIIASLILLNVASFRVAAAELKLVILHTNDMHSRFEATSKLSGKCLKSSSKCYGGFARVKRAVDEERRKIAADGMYSLFLNAGDNFQGSIYYSLFKWKIVAKLIGMLGIDVMSLGNHEFDDGVDGLAPYIRNVSIPIVTSNVDVSKEPKLQHSNLTPSKVVTVAGRKIGIIGYLTPESKFVASTGNVVFKDEVAAIKRESEKLRDSGVNIIIAVGHSGYPIDMKIAEKVPEVDVVVGGHTHTFLYTGKQPDFESPEGPYPTMITQPSGKKVPVVQAYAYTKYLGHLKVVFNDDGDVTLAEGNPILLDCSHAEDPEVLAELQKYNAKIDEQSKVEIGVTRVVLLGDTPCRLEECNLGNMITDAMVDYYSRIYKGSGWTDSPIAITQGGSIRTTLDLTKNQGIITYGAFLTVMPFENDLQKVRLKGSVLLDALEWSVRSYDRQKRDGRFLQYSGIRIVYDISKLPGKRVVSARLRCGNCTLPMYSPLNTSQEYTVIMSTYLATGGDGYDMFKNKVLKREILDSSDRGVVQKYIEKYSSVYAETNNRITFVSSSSAGPNKPSIATMPAKVTVNYFESNKWNNQKKQQQRAPENTRRPSRYDSSRVKLHATYTSHGGKVQGNVYRYDNAHGRHRHNKRQAWGKTTTPSPSVDDDDNRVNTNNTSKQRDNARKRKMTIINVTTYDECDTKSVDAEKIYELDDNKTRKDIDTTTGQRKPGRNNRSMKVNSVSGQYRKRKTPVEANNRCKASYRKRDFCQTW